MNGNDLIEHYEQHNERLDEEYLMRYDSKDLRNIIKNDEQLLEAFKDSTAVQWIDFLTIDLNESLPEDDTDR